MTCQTLHSGGILTVFYAFMLLLMNMSVFQDHSGVSQLTKLYFSVCFYQIKLTLCMVKVCINCRY